MGDSQEQGQESPKSPQPFSNFECNFTEIIFKFEMTVFLELEMMEKLRLKT